MTEDDSYNYSCHGKVMKFNIAPIHKNIHKGQALVYQILHNNNIIIIIITHDLGDPSSSRDMKRKIMYHTSTCTENIHETRFHIAIHPKQGSHPNSAGSNTTIQKKDRAT